MRDQLDSRSQARFDRGRRQATPCLTCHDLMGDAVKIGPGLFGLEGRRAGSAPGFPYSQAMRESGITWSAATLDAYLANGQGLVPGNKMVSPDIADPQRRADLVFFLLLVTRPPPEGP